MTPFSSIEVQLIKASLLSRSDGEIAVLLERPIEEIHSEINRITGGQAEARSVQVQAEREEIRLKQMTRQSARDKQLRDREQSRKLKEDRKRKEEKERSDRSQQLKYEHERKKKRESEVRKYVTREVDLSTMQSVRVDRKTIVFVKPGADVKKIVAMYRNKLSSSLNKSAI
jgi:hypothetical protein